MAAAAGLFLKSFILTYLAVLAVGFGLGKLADKCLEKD